MTVLVVMITNRNGHFASKIFSSGILAVTGQLGKQLKI